MKEYEDAYFTIEAALIVPMMIVIYFLFIYLCIFTYDKALLIQDSYYLLDKARETAWDDRDEMLEINRICKLIKEESPYLCCSDLQMDYSKKGNRLYIESSVEFRVPIGYLAKIWFRMFDQRLTTQKSTTIVKPQSIMRMTYYSGKEKKNGVDN